MLTTEAEAKTKACPERLRAIAAYQFIVQMMPNFGAGCGQSVAVATPTPSAVIAENCIGSACMAWRWGKAINVYETVPEEEKAARGIDFTIRQELGGYCGKAGKPVQLNMEDKP